MPRTAPHPACGARGRTKRGAFICGESHAPSPFAPRAGRRWRQPDEGLLQAFAGAALKKNPLWPAGHLPHKGGEDMRRPLVLSWASSVWQGFCRYDLGRGTSGPPRVFSPLVGEMAGRPERVFLVQPPHPHPKNITPRTPARSRTRPACCSNPRSVQPLPTAASCPSASRSSRRSCRGRSQGRRRGRRGR
ncbi:hypothetical protein C8J33_101666 [Rhizobium sp. PP-CC-3G-465]|nr:hypothetical protein C8J33_101666 [Rhizobium sp. PP-CC-3G-465]